MIGSLQWIITIGRFDIHTEVMTMSGFRIAPRIGHFERLNALICVRTKEPDFFDVPDPQYDWTYTVYGNTKEVLLKDAPEHYCLVTKALGTIDQRFLLN
jgi:hypothetical protein